MCIKKYVQSNIPFFEVGFDWGSFANKYEVD